MHFKFDCGDILYLEDKTYDKLRNLNKGLKLKLINGEEYHLAWDADTRNYKGLWKNSLITSKKKLL